MRHKILLACTSFFGTGTAFTNIDVTVIASLREEKVSDTPSQLSSLRYVEEVNDGSSRRKTVETECYGKLVAIESMVSGCLGWPQRRQGRRTVATQMSTKKEPE